MLQVVQAVALAIATQTALPPLATESLPPAARRALAPVYRDAAAQPENPRAVGLLASTLHAWELWEAAHLTYTRAARLDPKSFNWPYLDALVLQRLAQHAGAATRLRAALAISPDYLPARVKLAEALFEAGQLDESATLLTALAEEPLAAPAAEVGLGRIAAAQGQHEEAILHFQRAVTLFPELGAAHYAMALSYRALGRADEARRALARHQQYGPLWPAVDDPILARVTALRDDARTLVQRGMKLADAGDVAGAIAAHEAALVRDPSYVQAHSNLVSLYGRARDWTKAETHYRVVVDRGVNLADSHYDYGVIAGLQEKWDVAEDAYRKALAVNPLHTRALNNLGQILERRRKLEEAAQSYRQAIESEPGFRLARFNLGRMLIALERSAEAVAELEKLVEPRDADAPRYLFALSVAHMRAGRKADGIKWATDARDLAVQFGQHELAAAIERDLARVK